MLTFNMHILAISKSCFYHIRALRHIQPALTESSRESTSELPPLRKILDLSEPSHLFLRIAIAIPHRTLRSLCNTQELEVLPTRSKIGARGFRYSAL